MCRPRPVSDRTVSLSTMERRRAESVRLDNELGLPWPKLSWAAAAASDMLKKDANASASKSKILRDVDRRWERRDPFYNVRTRIALLR